MPIVVVAVADGCGACGSGDASDSPGAGASMQKAAADVETKDAKAQENTGPKRDNTPVVLVPDAPGEVIYETEGVCVDASNLSEGYVMICYTGGSEKVRMLLEENDDLSITIRDDVEDYCV